jgi:medium-chain acyl-[acyl-carrier-protein] hydrolase
MSQQIALYNPRPEAKIRLFCFPPAGGSASLFRNWAFLLPDIIEVSALRLPGRESRITEEPLRDYKEAIDEITGDLINHLQKPFAFFGHSMGALLAYGVAHKLQDDFALHPSCVIVSCMAAPHTYKSAMTFSPSQQPDLDDEQVIQEFKAAAAPAKDVIANQDFIKLLLPTIRADFAICDSFQDTASSQLLCHISAYGGLHDTLSRKDLEVWREETSNTFRVRMFPGGHHYLWQLEDLLLNHITRDILESGASFL